MNFGFLVLTIFKKHPESSGYKQEEWGLTVQYLHQRPDMPYGVYVTLLDQNGDIPTFLADGLPILRTVHEDTMNPEMLEGNHEYSIMKSGLYKKIYGYDTGGINYKDFSRLLSERFSGLNYPIYFNDIRRKFESHTSFEHIYGTRERLANLDPDIFDYNSSKMFWIDGHPIHLDLWLFSKTKRGDKARGKDTSKRITNYFPSGGASILMEVNSQINHIDKDFFAYTLKGELQHIKKDLSIIIDFDSIKDQSLLFDIFLPDRVSINKKHPFMVELYKEIKRFLLSDHGLQLQNQKRQQQAIEDARTINDTDQKYWQDFHSRYFNPAKPNTSIQPENEIPLEKHPKLLDHPTEWRLKSNKNNLKQIPLNQNHIQVAFITNANPTISLVVEGSTKLKRMEMILPTLIAHPNIHF